MEGVVSNMEEGVDSQEIDKLMFQLYKRIKWLYQSFQVSVWLPFAILILYTLFGASIFRAVEMDNDQRQRLYYRNQTTYALNQVVERMLEVRCHDHIIRASKELQLLHAREAIDWFMNHLNLTEVIEERSKDTPWDWLGAMFYAGQLYTTIGYGYPTTKTALGRAASIFYILFGIPIFLDMGRIMSRALRKFYKRLRTSKRKLETASKKVFRTAPADQKTAIITIAEMEKQNKENAKKNAANDASFPISIALFMLIFWILFSATLLNFWEAEWGYMTSVYFYFVSISTVGLGDIVFDNPDMMIYNFGLILVGLALLSMCFNLIQTALEKLFNRLLDEYIEEIEKMAHEVEVNETCTEEAMPLEFKMTGNLLTLPIKRVTHETGFFAEAKGWMASRIANKVLTKQLGIPEESESEEEEDEEAEEATPRTAATTEHDPESPKTPQSKHSTITTPRASHGSIPKVRNFNRLRGNGRLLNAVRTLEKIKPQKNDMRSMIFHKFLQSDKLGMLVDDNAKKSNMVTTSCQTDPDENDKIKWRKNKSFNRKESCTSFTSTIGTNSVFVDDESLLSAAYCDMKFDYSSEPALASPPSAMKSTLSILKLDDEEPLLPSKLSSALANWTPSLSPWKTAQLRVQTSNSLAAVHEVPSPVPTVSSQVTSPIKKYPSASDVSTSDYKTDDDLDGLSKTRHGLLSKEFDIMSDKSSNMADSGYDRSQQDDSLVIKIEPIAEDTDEQQSFV